RSLHRGDLAGGRNAEQKTATRREKLLGDQNGKCGSDPATHDTVFVAVVTENVQLGVIAGPALVAAGAFSCAQIAYDVAVGIENADFRNGDVRQSFLPAGLPQQVFGGESRGCLVTFVPKDRRRFCFTDGHCWENPRWALRRERPVGGDWELFAPSFHRD